ncbi:T9SS type A sorting domain-containing protein [Chryseobacterium fistulae]|uniref:Secretion system C-terminal sorting domain-containing protein n=1 Tax=Chryseobacterium fistulae TaxID=2675058 RepID=A0A6N4XWE0_9FLAO|nr:M64 family metallopeptidase [Chryseobacterium fistulae]CAA7390070.1 hypothetical protein CHRY9393_02368 [Chryseobacterium fistulae]
MKKKLFFILIYFYSFCFSQTFETVALIHNGNNDQRINIAVLGDGFTSSEQDSFISSAQSTLDYLFTKSPYAEYRNYFNAYAIKVISGGSGVKHPGTASDVAEPVIPISNPNNYLGTSFDFGVHRCIYSNATNRVAQVLAANVPDYDITYILGNSKEYGGCGGTYAFASLNASSDEIVVHELGHSFGKLADEYWFSGTGESPNKTKTSSPTSIRWRNWLNTDNISIYPYTESPTWFRPHQNCEMRYLNRQFCSVCTEAIIERIHSLISPVDSYMPANDTVLEGYSDITFTVNEVLPIPNTLINTWVLNGNVLEATENTITITPQELNMGDNTLAFSVNDNTPLVRVNNHSAVHFTNVAWTLVKNERITTKVNVKERRFVIYPNPVNNELYIEGKEDFSNNISVTLYDAVGRLIPIKFELKDTRKIQIGLKTLPAGVYTLNLLEDSGVIISHKIIKEND